MPKSGRHAPSATRRRPPRTAAVTLTRKADTVQYADLLMEAKQRINLEELGINETLVKRAITGGIIIEIPGD